jgi:hypothetical protein
MYTLRKHIPVTLYVFAWENLSWIMRVLRRLQKSIPRIKCDRNVLSRSLEEEIEKKPRKPVNQLPGLTAGIRTHYTRFQVQTVTVISTRSVLIKYSLLGVTYSVMVRCRGWKVLSADKTKFLDKRIVYLYYYYLLTAIGIMPGGSVKKIGRTYKKWTYTARKQNIHLTTKQHISQNFTVQYKCNEQNTRYNK